MAGLDPAIHVFLHLCCKDVNARHRRQVYAVCADQAAAAGHDESLRFDQDDGGILAKRLAYSAACAFTSADT
jgi:hypothetical protein